MTPLAQLSPEEEAEARRVFASVFRGTTALRAPFADGVPARGVLADGLDDVAWEAIRLAALAAGDTWAYLATYWFNWDERDDFEAWTRIDLRTPDGYAAARSLPAGLHEHVVFSPRGLWGAIEHESGDAFVAGSPDFMAAMRARLPRGEAEEVAAWLEHRRELAGGRSGVTDWLPDCLRHLYGAERAAELLQDA